MFTLFLKDEFTYLLVLLIVYVYKGKSNYTQRPNHNFYFLKQRVINKKFDPYETIESRKEGNVEGFVIQYPAKKWWEFMLSNHEKTIYFENQYSEYGYFSNFYKSPFWVEGKIYQTNQHFFQSKKFSGKKLQKDIAEAASPEIAYDLGRKKENPMRKDWRQIREVVMYQGLKHKFTQHVDLKKKLLETGDCMLVEHYQHDKYWSDGGDGSGLNRQGHLLMKLREELRQEQTK